MGMGEQLRILMPADRRITINVTSEGYRNEFGELVEGTITPIEAWASRLDRSQEDKATEGGSRDETRRDWRIRWDARIANASTLTSKSWTERLPSQSPTWLKSHGSGARTFDVGSWTCKEFTDHEVLAFWRQARDAG